MRLRNGGFLPGGPSPGVNQTLVFGTVIVSPTATWPAPPGLATFCVHLLREGQLASSQDALRRVGRTARLRSIVGLSASAAAASVGRPQRQRRRADSAFILAFLSAGFGM